MSRSTFTWGKRSGSSPLGQRVTLLGDGGLIGLSSSRVVWSVKREGQSQTWDLSFGAEKLSAYCTEKPFDLCWKERGKRCWDARPAEEPHGTTEDTPAARSQRTRRHRKPELLRGLFFPCTRYTYYITHTALLSLPEMQRRSRSDKCVIQLSL